MKPARWLLMFVGVLVLLVVLAKVVYQVRENADNARRHQAATAPTSSRLPTSSLPSSSAPVARLTTSAPSDPQAGTGAREPNEPAATGPRYYAGLAISTQRATSQSNPELQTLAFALRDYRAALGQNPVGSNPEITRALQGENTRNANFLRGNLPLNARGELVDQWGTPYFFHQISRTEIDLYSAGPDRTMWTDDDQITR